MVAWRGVAGGTGRGPSQASQWVVTHGHGQDWPSASSARAARKGRRAGL